MDRGAERRAAVQDGRVYLIVGLGKADRLVTLDAATGEVVNEQPDPTLQAPYPIGNDGETVGRFEGRYGVDWDLERPLVKPAP